MKRILQILYQYQVFMGVICVWVSVFCRKTLLRFYAAFNFIDNGKELSLGKGPDN
jgi:hypothetical protein